jgi:hypothetical protein
LIGSGLRRFRAFGLVVRFVGAGFVAAGFVGAGFVGAGFVAAGSVAAAAPAAFAERVDGVAGLTRAL